MTDEWPEYADLGLGDPTSDSHAVGCGALGSVPRLGMHLCFPGCSCWCHGDDAAEATPDS